MGLRLSEFSKLRKREDFNNSNSNSSSHLLSVCFVPGTQLGASPSNPSIYHKATPSELLVSSLLSLTPSYTWASLRFLKFSLMLQLQVI